MFLLVTEIISWSPYIVWVWKEMRAEWLCRIIWCLFYLAWVVQMNPEATGGSSALFWEIYTLTRDIGHPKISGEMDGWWTLRRDESNIPLYKLPILQQMKHTYHIFVNFCYFEKVVLCYIKELRMRIWVPLLCQHQLERTELPLEQRCEWWREFSDARWIEESIDHEHGSRIYVLPFSNSKSNDKGINHRNLKDTRLFRTQTYRHEGVFTPQVEKSDLLCFWERWEDTESEVEERSHRYQFLPVTNKKKRTVVALHIFLSCHIDVFICIYDLFSSSLFF